MCNKELDRYIAVIPDDKLLLKTDSPYDPPVKANTTAQKKVALNAKRKKQAAAKREEQQQR